MDEDLNVSAAWGAIFEWVRENNRLLAAGQLSALQAAAALAAWDKIDAVLGLKQAGPSAAPAPLLALLEERQAARKAKDFKRADAIRDELKSKGWTAGRAAARTGPCRFTFARAGWNADRRGNPPHPQAQQRQPRHDP